MKSTTHSLKNLGLLAIALTLALAANVAYGQWSNPPASPPNNNVAAPINVSNMAQTKYATITAPFLRAADPTRGMMSDAYCDYDGNNCWDPGTGTGPGGGGWNFVSSPVAHPGWGNTVAVDTGFGAPPAAIQIDMVAQANVCGYSTGDIIYDVGSAQTSYGDRNHDWGIAAYNEGNGLVHIKVGKAIGIIEKGSVMADSYECHISSHAVFGGRPESGPSDWAFVVKASDGSGGGGSVPIPPNCTGSNALQWAAGSWSCVAVTSGSVGSWAFESVATTHPGDGNTLTVSHGLGFTPNEVEVQLVNVVAEAGYNPGDRIYNISSGSTWDDRWKGTGLTAYADSATEIKARISPRGIMLMDLSVAYNCSTQGCSTHKLTPANWEVVVKAR